MWKTKEPFSRLLHLVVTLYIKLLSLTWIYAETTSLGLGICRSTCRTMPTLCVEVWAWRGMIMDHYEPSEECVESISELLPRKRRKALIHWFLCLIQLRIASWVINTPTLLGMWMSSGFSQGPTWYQKIQVGRQETYSARFEGVTLVQSRPESVWNYW